MRCAWVEERIIASVSTTRYLLKENHIALAGGVTAALGQAHAYASSQMKPQDTTAYEATAGPRSAPPDSSLPIQIEVRYERELRDALDSGAESVLLDNMTPDAARRCVQLARSLRRECVVEISGGITLDNARAYAETGADFLSSGALTHSAPASRPEPACRPHRRQVEHFGQRRS